MYSGTNVEWNRNFPAVPRGRIHVVPVLETLVPIEPRWRGYEYFVYEEEIVVVDPRTMQIVAVLTV